jgi:hypothetical protein
MINRLLSILIIFLSITGSSSLAQPQSTFVSNDSIGNYLTLSFKGSISNLPIWMDIKLPTSKGKVSGTYFYKKHGKEIALFGEKTGQKMFLKENHENKITGIFELEFRENNIVGNWHKPGTTASKPVMVDQTNPENKPCYLINEDNLSLTGGGTFGNELDQHSGENYQEPDDLEQYGRQEYEITCCKKPLLSVRYKFSFFGGRPFPNVSTIQHTFDLTNNNEINLWDEIEANKKKSFDKYRV